MSLIGRVNSEITERVEDPGSLVAELRGPVDSHVWALKRQVLRELRCDMIGRYNNEHSKAVLAIQAGLRPQKKIYQTILGVGSDGFLENSGKV